MLHWFLLIILEGNTFKIDNMDEPLCRRLLHDDGRGVGEALNETVCVGDNCAGLTVSIQNLINI